MKEFFGSIFSSPWGIAAFCAVAAAVFVFIAAIFYRAFFKRFFDLLLSLFALAVLSPLFLFLIVAGAVAMKGNPFFVQKRPGKKKRKTGKERIFSLIKFRTMSNAKDEEGNLLPDEKRLNGYGKFLRSSSLDELPELINILKGDMALVGPRPQLVRDMVFMTEDQRRRHSVRPGLTGLAQINGRNNITWEQKFLYDLRYIDGGISLAKDIGIIFGTVFKVLKRDDVVREGTASDVDFGQYLLDGGAIGEEEFREKMDIAKKLLENGGKDR